MDSLRALGVKIKVRYRHLPGARHRFAIPAIQASECAADAGKFESMHDMLFRHTDSLGIVPWWWFAKAAGVQDSVRFHQCMARTDRVAALTEDTVAARRLGATGTPTLLIHEIRSNGLPTFDSLRAYIDRVTPKPGQR
jgi:protein-disulfide isomerase